MNKYIYFLLLSLISIDSINAMEQPDNSTDELGAAPLLMDVSHIQDTEQEQSSTGRGKNTYTCGYQECGERLYQLSNLRDHIIAKHLKELSPWKCQNCQNKFSTKRLLEAHIKSQHKGLAALIPPLSLETKEGIEQAIKPYVLVNRSIQELSGKDNCCQYPNCTFSGAPAWLKKHIIEVHYGKKPFACPAQKCEMRYKVKNALVRHMNKTHKDQPDLEIPEFSQEIQNEISDLLELYMPKQKAIRTREQRIQKPSIPAAATSGENALDEDTIFEELPPLVSHTLDIPESPVKLKLGQKRRESSKED